MLDIEEIFWLDLQRKLILYARLCAINVLFSLGIALLNSTEKRTLFGVSTALLFRMMGLFMVLPVLAVSADKMLGATPFLVGIALGAYGLTQGLLQIPMGRLSDKIGRHKVVVFGLIIFFIGSVVAALADNIYTLILGRFLQGGGAIASALMALIADATRPQYRDIAMAIVGASMGLAMMIAMVAGVTLAAQVGLSGVFWVTAALALCGLALFIIIVPKTPVIISDRTMGSVAVLSELLKNRWVRILSLGVAIIHFAIIAFFLILPPRLEAMGWAQADTWKVYVPALALSIVGMAPIMMLSRRKSERVSLMVAASVLVFGFILFELSGLSYGVYIALWLFFVGFNTLEATMPSLLSKVVEPQNRGSVMGIYATSQFFGAFLGGALCGWLDGSYGVIGVILVTVILGLIWVLLVNQQKLNPLKESTA